MAFHPMANIFRFLMLTVPYRAISMALKDAQVIAFGNIDYINAHATSTPIGDQNEAKAIDHIFGSWLNRLFLQPNR